MAFHGWPISQCQSPSTPLSSQLLGGIRILDIRLAVIPPPLPGSTALTNDQQLIAYHGLWPQKTPFLSILSDIETFLTSLIGSKETIVMSIKQEDFVVTPAPLFSQLVHQTIISGPGGWSEQKNMEDFFDLATRQRLDNKWASFFYEANIAFNVVRHPSFVSVVQEISKAAIVGYHPTSYNSVCSIVNG